MFVEDKTDGEVTSDLFTLDSLISWLRGKKPDSIYHYTSNTECLLGQYFHFHGYPNVIVYPNHVFLHGRGKEGMVKLPGCFHEIALYNNTFGGALASAIKLKGGL